MASQEDMEITLKFEPEEDIMIEETIDDVVSSVNEENLIEDYKVTVKNKLIEKTNDIHDKLMIAKNVLEVCQDESSNTQTNSMTHWMNKLQHYTKLPYNDLTELIKETKVGKRSLKTVIVDTKPLPHHNGLIVPHIYADIRDIFIEYYVKNKQMPTIIHFLKSLYDKRDDFFYKNANIRAFVKNDLVKYHHLHNLDRYILTENPEFAYRRHLYLRQIIRYRAQGKDIVYFAVLQIENSEKRPSFLCIAANMTGVIAKSEILRYAGLHDDNNGIIAVKFWIRNILLSRLSPSSVIVLIQPRKKNTTPTHYSTKQQMLDWLYKRNIPVDENSHKAHLYSLVKIHQKKEKKQGFYEEILESAGFNVLVCPIEYSTLNIFHDIHIKAKKAALCVKMIKIMCHEEWKTVEDKLIEEERQMMNDDEEMEKIIENLFQMVKNGDLKAEDFPEGCRGSKEDNFTIHIGDFIVD